MNTRRSFRLAVWILTFLLVAGLAVVVAQQAPPTDTKGMKSTVVASIDLGPEIEGMQGRQLRMRVLTFEPGGHVGLHNHKDRPTVVRVLQGTLTNHRQGASSIEVQEGQSFAEGKDSTHWVENRGTKPVTLVVVDILKQP